MRKCPYCKSTVSPWSVIKPGLWKNSKIKCNACGKEISDYWAQINFLVWFVPAIITVIFIQLIDDVWYMELLYLFLFMCFLLVLAYLIIPFNKKEEE